MTYVREEHKKRQQTGSVTHLVKIVASEVFTERWEKAVANLKKEFQSCTKYTIVDTEKYFKEINSDMSNAYGIWWQNVEDVVLRKEVALAIKIIASKHHRSEEAIRQRILKIL